MRVPLILSLSLLVCSYGIAAPACIAPELDSAAFRRAENLVQRLPEFRAWSKAHKFPVAYDSVADPIVREGRCYISVAVSASRPERLELWQLFYVNATRRSVLIQEPINGEIISLKKWRINEVAKHPHGAA